MNALNMMSISMPRGQVGTPPARRVLLVDQDPFQVSIIRLHLERAGHRIVVAASAVQAMALAQGERPDLIVISVAEPGPDGFGFCRSLRSDWALRTTPVVLYGDQANHSKEVRRAVRCGANMLVSLSHGPEAVLYAIRHVLAHPDLWLEPMDSQPVQADSPGWPLCAGGPRVAPAVVAWSS